ncbi:unnamed protein product [Ranitomeya imitator]|uniref:Uncharacterized protein n=1 Tax=Ranitomeya imitator TaxID=111125 RepID=A0ABN9KU38_9NEOB|nr:unnamed protein product [Ranitomeya imitator]
MAYLLKTGSPIIHRTVDIGFRTGPFWPLIYFPTFFRAMKETLKTKRDRRGTDRRGNQTQARTTQSQDGNQGKHRVTKRSPVLSYPMFTLVTSEDIAESVSRLACIGITPRRQSLHNKAADKGGAIVFMDHSYYIEEALRQLGDTSIYKTLPRDPISSIKSDIQDVLNKYIDSGILDKKTSEFLTNHNPVIPVFYTLWKIHKNPLKPPGRAIVTSTDSFLSPIAIYLKKKNFVSLHQNY